MSRLRWLARAAAPVAAQDYPNKTVRVIIPLGAGGGGDIFTRAMSDELQKRLGQTFIVENRTGGGLNIGTRACGEAPPDGYTLCVLSSEPIVYSQFLFKSLPFNPEKDFEPITNLFFNTLAFAVNNSLKVKTVAGADGARQEAARQAQLLDVLVSAGALHGRPEEEIRRRHRARAVSQRQRGDDRAAFRRHADHAARACPTWCRPCRPARSPRWRSTPIRARRCFPTVPTLKEATGENYPQSWFGLFAPAGTPKPIVAKLHKEVAAITGDPAFMQKMYIERAVEHAVDTPENVRALHPSRIGRPRGGS